MKQTFLRNAVFFILLTVPLLLSAQGTVTGNVTETSNGSPLPGVNVIVKGTTTGTITEIDGSFELTVAQFPATLVFSSLGYANKEVKVAGATNLNVTIEESATGLQEVVITGLASSVKRENLANAVSTVSAAELVGTTSQSTVDGALYGKIAGVNITATSGAPGGGFALRLRGISSINGNNQPLIIVDGVYYNNVEIPSGLRFASGANRGNEENSGNRLADLDPNDIQNIEVLKGSSAAAIYGQRGNAGVILITTKRGKTGKTKINFSHDVGMNTISKRLGMRPWTADLVESTFGVGERAKYEATMASNGALYDYEDIIYGNTGFITDTRLSATGGSDNTKFYLGGAYRDEGGIIKNTGFDRFTLRSNIDHRISDIFDFTSSTSYTRSNSSRSFTGNENDGGLSFGYTLAFTRPWINQYPDDIGNYPINPNYPGNPIFVRDEAWNKDSNDRLVQGMTLNTKILQTEKDKLKLVTSGGLDYLANQTNVNVPETHQAQAGKNAPGGLIVEGKNNFTQLNTQVIGVWNREAMNNNLDFTTQLGVTYLYQKANTVSSRGSKLASGQTSVNQSVNQVNDQFRSVEQDFGYFGQVEGNYKDQLIATIGYRMDKSSRNGKPNKFHGFPKASLAVNIANFDFWSLESISQLKLRAAYGETGSPANYGSTFTSMNANNIGGNIGQSVIGRKGDPLVKPETSSELEFGFDLGIFNNKLSFEATYYNKNVKDLILTRPLPSSSGYSEQTTNLGDLKNTGIELALNAFVFDKENFKWNTRVQWYTNRSEITRLDVPAFAQPNSGFGLGLGTFYIEQGKSVTQLVGNLDLDGTGKKPTKVGDVEPDFQMGWSNNFTLYRQFEVSFLFNWKKGGQNLNLTNLLSDLGKLTADLDTPEGQARLLMPEDAVRFVEPAGYVKLREASIHYSFSKNTVNSVFGKTVEGVKFGLSGRNLITISDYSGYDPEVSVNGGSGLSTGIEVGAFPSSRQFFLSLNVNF